jgi:CRISPR-associated protein (TIGR03986 family)
MSELLFGAVGARPRRGRVRSSVAIFETPPQAVRFPAEGALVAGNPAASAVTMYVVQDSDRTFQRGPKNRLLMTYDDDQPVLRGRKLYWHRQRPQAPLPPNANLNVQAVYHPLAAGSRFNFTVSFERLTLTELGALVEALEYPDDHAHKLGLGKPFGLGSVRLEINWAATSIEADRDRYASLRRRIEMLATHDNGTGEQSESQRLAKEARGRFRTAVLQADRKPATGNFDDLPHVRQFRCLTNWRNPADPQSIRYMLLSDRQTNAPTYATKAILDEPETTVEVARH